MTGQFLPFAYETTFLWVNGSAGITAKILVSRSIGGTMISISFTDLVPIPHLISPSVTTGLCLLIGPNGRNRSQALQGYQASRLK